MSESIHRFFKGLDQDVAVDKLSPTQYFDALNMRIVTDEGGTSGNIQNIKGNVYNNTIPVVPAIWQVTGQVDFVSTEFSDFTIDINGFVLNTTNTPETFTALMDIINNDPTYQLLGVRAYTNEGSIYDSIPTLYITLSSGTLTSVSITATGATLDAAIYSENISGTRIIGWVAMREDIILLTSNSVAENPTNTLGQIWRLTYDKETLISNLELLYNNYLNLSLAHPVANPGMIEARYETPSVQNIYWTDKHNTPRVANVADPQLFSVDPRLLSLNTIVSPFLPIAQKIHQSGGGLKTGIHYLSYRLANTTSGETSWFPVSYGTRILERDDETTPVVAYNFFSPPGYTLTDRGYDGGHPANTGNVYDLDMGRTTSKSILYLINGIDTNYDRIEFAHIYKKTREGTPEITIVGNEPVSSDSLQFTLTGNETDVVPITLEEFLSSSSVFTTVGTLAAKDNYLFVADVNTQPLDVEWDARAYRFNASQVCEILDDLGNTFEIGVDFPTFADVPEDFAAINPNDDPFSDLNFLYQQDGITFGGEGQNVKYEFITTPVLLDTRPPLLGGGGAIENPVRDVIRQTSSYNINSSVPINQEYDSLDTFRSYHSPYLEGFLKGYTRDEVYRFSITFFDHSHNPLFTKWIADIRMPHVYMPDGPTPADRIITYPITNDSADYSSDYVLDGNVLGVRFTISNLDLISERVSGYSITRCKRLWKDRTIVGQGLFQVAHHDPFPSGITVLPPPTPNSYTTSVNGNTANVSGSIASMYIPELLFPGVNAYKYRSGDTVDIVGIYTTDMAQSLPEQGGGLYGVGLGYVSGVVKNYTHGADPESILNGDTPYTIDETLMRGGWWDGGHGEFTLGPVTRIQNNGGVNTAWDADYRSAGGKLLVLRGDFANFDATGDDYTAVDGLTNTPDAYIANYKKNLKTGHLSTQYSGNTFSQRSRSEYISTNHYQPVKLTSTTFSNDVYGGDTFITILDYTQSFLDTGSPGSSAHINRYFPVETTVNVELRQAITNDIKIPNKEIYPDANPIQTEEFLVNVIFSHENDIVKYFPKPEPFIVQTEFDCRIYNSETPKINGELADSWRKFKSEDYIEVDSKYGPINIILPHRNRLFYFQDTGFGIYQTNEKALVQDADGGEIILGTGGLKQRFDYISEKVGSKHKFGFTVSPTSIFFFDITNKRAYLFGEGLTELQGLNGFFQANLRGDVLTNDNPYIFKGITATYDYKYNEFLISFHDLFVDNQRTDVPNPTALSQFTIAYNEPVKAFTSFYSFLPPFYINDKYNIITSIFLNSQEDLYIHNVGNYADFYQAIYPSYVTFVLNDKPDMEKVFDNFIINSKTYLNKVDVPNETFDTFRVWNDYQDTGDKDFSNKGRFIKRKWNASIGGDLNNTNRTERIKSNYAFTKFTTVNDNNHNIVLEGVLTKYRVNPTMIFN